MVNVHVHWFDGSAPVIDAQAMEVFQAQWSIYQKLVDSNALSHQEIGHILYRELAKRFTRPICFLDIACGDASVPRRALTGIAVRHYHGIDLAAPALELAAKNLERADFEVDLDCQDFVTALTGRQEHADAVWCSLSLHHLHTPEKQRVMSAIRRSLGPDGIFLLYEPTLDEGEDLPAYLDRTYAIISKRWTALDRQELEDIWHHIRDNDLPEQPDTWLALGRAAGFSDAQQIFADPSGLYRMFRYLA